MLSGHPDAILVERSCRGDRKAYDELVRRHSRRVFAVCLGMLRNTHDAEDIAQQALIKGFEKLGELKERAQFGAWIVRIARNLCIDFQRRKRVIAPVKTSKHGDSIDRSLSSDLHEALKRLPEEYRLPLMLYYFDGQDTQRVAEVLNMSPAGALTRLSRARVKLREILNKMQGGQ